VSILGLTVGSMAASAVALGITGAALLRRGLSMREKRKTVLKIPITSISDAQSGLVEVSGTATSQVVVKSPFQRLDCVAYHCKVERRGERYRNEDGIGTNWHTVVEESSANQFVIDDGIARLRIDPRGSDTNFDRKRRFEYESDAPNGKKFLPPPILDYVDDRQIEMKGLMRFVE